MQTNHSTEMARTPMSLSRNKSINEAKFSSHKVSSNNQTHFNFSGDKTMFTHYSVRFLVFSTAFISISLTSLNLVAAEKLSQPGVAIAGNDKSGCEHNDACFPTPV